MQGNAIISNQVNSLIENIQLTGYYKSKIAKVYTVMGRRAGFTSTSVLKTAIGNPEITIVNFVVSF